MVEGADCLLDGCVAVGTMRVDQVDVFKAQSLEGLVCTFDDMLAGKTNVVDWIAAVSCSPVDLEVVN